MEIFTIDAKDLSPARKHNHEKIKFEKHRRNHDVVFNKAETCSCP